MLLLPSCYRLFASLAESIKCCAETHPEPHMTQVQVEQVTTGEVSNISYSVMLLTYQNFVINIHIPQQQNIFQKEHPKQTRC